MPRLLALLEQMQLRTQKAAHCLEVFRENRSDICNSSRSSLGLQEVNRRQKSYVFKLVVANDKLIKKKKGYKMLY